MEVLASITDFFVKLSMIFIVLLALTHLVYFRYFKKFIPDSQSSTMVMALALFFLGVLPHLQVPYLTLTVLSLELAIIWVYISLFYLVSIEGNPALIMQPGQLRYLGCWVSSTVILAILLDQMQPLLHGAILMLLFFALCASVFCFFQLARRLYQRHRLKIKNRVENDCVMMAITLILMGVLVFELFADRIDMLVYHILLGTSLGVYLLAWFEFAYRFNCYQRSNGFINYINDNVTLLYAYAALLGYFMVETSFWDDIWVDIIWVASMLLFAAVEIVRLRHVSNRFLQSSQRQWLLQYQRSRWLSLFSWGAMYIFVLSYYYQYASDSYLAHWIVYVVPYVLLLAFLYQIVLGILVVRDASN